MATSRIFAHQLMDVLDEFDENSNPELDLEKALEYIKRGTKHREVLNRIKRFLEDGGKNLTKSEYIILRKTLGENNQEYNTFIKDAISEGYDSGEARRTSMLFQDYITDQHYRILLTPEDGRDNLDHYHQHTKFMGKLTPKNDIKKDLRRPIYDRSESEATFYGIERALLNPHDNRGLDQKLAEANSLAQNIDTNRLSKYKAHTLEMAATYADSKAKSQEEVAQTSSFYTRLVLKVSGYLRGRR